MLLHRHRSTLQGAKRSILHGSPTTTPSPFLHHPSSLSSPATHSTGPSHGLIGSEAILSRLIVVSGCELRKMIVGLAVLWHTVLDSIMETSIAGHIALSVCVMLWRKPSQCWVAAAMRSHVLVLSTSSRGSGAPDTLLCMACSDVLSSAAGRRLQGMSQLHTAVCLFLFCFFFLHCLALALVFLSHIAHRTSQW